MTISKLVLAAAAAGLIGSAALADESLTGRILKIDQPNGKIVIEHKATGTVGAAGGNTLVDEYSLQNDAVLRSLQVGEAVNFTTAQIDGKLAVTGIHKQ
jgi:Cu/Ag efflux protein CusF